jgi:major membrane immunogen (membrane-anchored lipoprotein)
MKTILLISLLFLTACNITPISEAEFMEGRYTSDQIQQFHRFGDSAIIPQRF